MPNIGGAALTGVWMFNWEETCRQVRSEYVMVSYSSNFLSFFLCGSGGHLLVPLWVLPAPLVM
jgi:hypothetical protein